MIIRKIEVRNFRKLAEPVVIDGLGPGATLIAGDNEDGKSTLVEAIRTAFFVKHSITGEFADAMQPYNSNVRPEVRIEFELDGQVYRLFKAYCQRPQAELVTPAATFNGSAAEEHLSQLLRVSLSKRIRKGDHEHEGVFGMFWVEQGKSLVLEPNAAGRTSILEALQKEVGDVLGGKRGQRLIAEVSRRHEELLTGAGKPRGAYASAMQAVRDIGIELATVEGQLADHCRTTDELERCISKLAQYEGEGALGAARERLGGAQRASEKIAGLQNQVHDADLALQAANARRQCAADQAAQRGQLVEVLALADSALKTLAESLAADRDRASHVRRILHRDDQVLADAEAHSSRVEQELKRAEGADRLATSRIRLGRLQQDHTAALAANQERESARAVAAGIAVDKASLNQLRRQQDAVTSARARLESLATQIEMSIAPGANVLLGNKPVVGEQRRTLTRATVIEAPGSLRLSIFPGAAVGNPQADLEAANHDLDGMLQRVGASSLADAEEQFERRATELSRADASARVIAAHAPQGIEALSLQIAAALSEMQALESFLGPDPHIEPREASERVAVLRQSHLDAKAAVDAARRQVDQTRAQLNQAINAETADDARHSHQEALCSQYRERLASERVLASDEELGRRLLQATQEAKTAETALAAARHALDEADPDAVAQELRIATAAHQRLYTEISSLREKAIRMESGLRVSGGLGLGERRDELQARMAAAEAEARRIERQAKALDLLLRVLLDAESAAKEQFLRPVTDRVQAYLKILLPGTELAFDEDINIVGLRRGATVEPFQSLSVGTREQLAVLTRLSFAELLQEHGHPAAVLLDDAIVFADDERFERMLRILDKAAQKLQVIVFSCRERDYRALGAPIIRLADCSARTAVAR